MSDTVGKIIEQIIKAFILDKPKMKKVYYSMRDSTILNTYFEVKPKIQNILDDRLEELQSEMEI